MNKMKIALILTFGVIAFATFLLWPELKAQIQARAALWQATQYCSNSPKCDFAPEPREIPTTTQTAHGSRVSLQSIAINLPAGAEIIDRHDDFVRAHLGEEGSITIQRKRFAELDARFAEAGGYAVPADTAREEMVLPSERKKLFLRNLFTTTPARASDQHSAYHIMRSAAFLFVKSSLMSGGARDAFYAYTLAVSSSEYALAYQQGVDDIAIVELAPPTPDEYWYTIFFTNMDQTQIDRVLKSLEIVSES